MGYIKDAVHYTVMPSTCSNTTSRNIFFVFGSTSTSMSIWLLLKVLCWTEVHVWLQLQGGRRVPQDWKHQNKKIENYYWILHFFFSSFLQFFFIIQITFFNFSFTDYFSQSGSFRTRQEWVISNNTIKKCMILIWK